MRRVGFEPQLSFQFPSITVNVRPASATGSCQPLRKTFIEFSSKLSTNAILVIAKFAKMSGEIDIHIFLGILVLKHLSKLRESGNFRQDSYMSTNRN